MNPHHGSDYEQVRHRRMMDEMFSRQIRGKMVREWPNGRAGGDDDGALMTRIATDFDKRIIRIEFAEPTNWVGLDIESAERMRNELTERILSLRGINANA